MEFTTDHKMWKTNQNRATSRDISTEKLDALNVLIDSLLDLGVIQPSKATAWSQVHFVRKPNNGGWRFTIDYISLNKVILNEGWQIPSMKKQGFCQMPLENSRAPTAFICFRGIYE